MQDLEHLKEHLKGKVVILGIGSTLRSDDGIGSVIALSDFVISNGGTIRLFKTKVRRFFRIYST